MIEIKSIENGVVHLRISGMLDHEDYEATMPRLAAAHESEGTLGYVIDVGKFRGWTPPALVDDLRFDQKYADRFGRVAFVGDQAGIKLGSRFANLFFEAEMRSFASDQRAEALAWVQVGLPEPSKQLH